MFLEKFGSEPGRIEFVSLQQALGRFLGMDVIAQEDVPAFNRSTVDGFAVRSADLRGCSDSIPALLQKSGESIMGQAFDLPLAPGSCVYVPTGGAIPPNADTAMLSTPRTLRRPLAFYKPVAPGATCPARETQAGRGDP